MMVGLGCSAWVPDGMYWVLRATATAPEALPDGSGWKQNGWQAVVIVIARESAGKWAVPRGASYCEDGHYPARRGGLRPGKTIQ